MKEWFLAVGRVLRREFRLVLGSPGAMLFFFALPLLYPIVYALIYNPEVTREMPVAVVDNSRTALSRELVRHADATEAIKICGYAADKAEARRWWMEKRCIAVLEIPEDYTRRIGRGQQGVVNFYSDVSLLLRYRTFQFSLTELQMATDAELREMALSGLGITGSEEAAGGIQTMSEFLGDTQQGFASFLLPGIVVLIVQQSMLLGITFLFGARRDRRRRFGGRDPFELDVPAGAQVIGKTLCYVVLYLPIVIYIFHYIPLIFAFPHHGRIIDYFLLMLPFLLATALLGQCLQVMVSERESAFVVVVFTSVAFLFLSGLTWPRYAMSPLWQGIGDFIPVTWAMNGFLRINSNDATLQQQTLPYLWLWGLTLLYFLLAYIVTRRDPRPVPNTKP